MNQKRVPLGQRRMDDQKGLDALFTPSESRAPEPVESQNPGSPKFQKVTLYLRPDQVLGVEEIQVRQRRLTGRRPDKSELVQEALDLLIQKYGKE